MLVIFNDTKKGKIISPLIAILNHKQKWHEIYLPISKAMLEYPLHFFFLSQHRNPTNVGESTWDVGEKLPYK